MFWLLPILVSTYLHLRNHIKFMPTSFSSTVHQHIALVKLSNCCVERIKVRLYFAGFLTSKQPVYPVDYQIWTTVQERVYHTDTHSVDELKQWLIQV